ncbi:ribbon-helix-helix domain-containing protein [Escherichia coli]
MQENETKKNKSTVVLSLRVPESEAAMYDAMCKDANLSRSELLRAIIKTKTKTNGGGVVINAPQKKVKNPDYSKLIFYYNKASNNINQIAKKINSAFAAKIISEEAMLSGIKVLQGIEKLLEMGLENGNHKG